MFDLLIGGELACGETLKHTKKHDTGPSENLPTSSSRWDQLRTVANLSLSTKSLFSRACGGSGASFVSAAAWKANLPVTSAGR